MAKKNPLKAINAEAKRLAARTGRSYKSCQKEAGKKYREGKIGAIKKKRRPETKKKAGPKRKRTISGATRSGKRGSKMGAVPAAKHVLKEELGWALATQRTAKTKREKKALQPKINKLTRQVKALS